MSMSVNGAVRSMEIKDPVLNALHLQREGTYAVTKKQVDEMLPTLQKNVVDIEAFDASVRTMGKKYQDRLVTPLPSQQKLNEEKNEVLANYENFKIVHEKAALMADNILSTIQFLTPAQRNWQLEKALERDNPELFEQTKYCDKVCQDYVAELSLSRTKVADLTGKLLSWINSTSLTWSLQRFCQIVDNGGKPLAVSTRGVNYFSCYFVTPDIPKPDKLAIQSPQKNEAEKVSGEKEKEQNAQTATTQANATSQANSASSPEVGKESNAPKEDEKLSSTNAQGASTPVSTAATQVSSSSETVNTQAASTQATGESQASSASSAEVGKDSNAPKIDEKQSSTNAQASSSPEVIASDSAESAAAQPVANPLIAPSSLPNAQEQSSSDIGKDALKAVNS